MNSMLATKNILIQRVPVTSEHAKTRRVGSRYRLSLTPGHGMDLQMPLPILRRPDSHREANTALKEVILNVRWDQGVGTQVIAVLKSC